MGAKVPTPAPKGPKPRPSGPPPPPKFWNVFVPVRTDPPFAAGFNLLVCGATRSEARAAAKKSLDLRSRLPLGTTVRRSLFHSSARVR